MTTPAQPIRYLDLNTGTYQELDLSQPVVVTSATIRPLIATSAMVFVTEKAFELASGYLAGQQQAQALADLKNDFMAAIQTAVNELKAYLSQQLDARIIAECQGEVNGMLDNLQQYHRSPDMLQGLLVIALNNINRVLSILSPFEIAALGPYVQACAMRLAVLSAIYNKSKYEGDLHNLVAYVDSQSATVRLLVQQVIHEKQRLIDGVGEIMISDVLGCIHGTFIDNGFKWKGTMIRYDFRPPLPGGRGAVRRPPTQDELDRIAAAKQYALSEVLRRENETRNAVLTNRRNDLAQAQEHVAAPILAIVQQWQALRDQAQGLLQSTPDGSQPASPVAPAA